MTADPQLNPQATKYDVLQYLESDSKGVGSHGYDCHIPLYG